MDGRMDDGNGSRCSDDDDDDDDIDDYSNDDERMKVSVGCRLPPSSCIIIIVSH